MRNLRSAGGIALLAAISLTGGCGLIASSPDESPIPADPTMLAFVDPSTIAGLSTRTITGTRDQHVHISYPVLPNAPGLTDKLRAEVTAELRAFDLAAPRPAPATPDEPHTAKPPELNVDWQLTAYSPQVIGVRLRTGRFTGGVWHDSLCTIWYDRATGRAVDSPGLLKEGALAAVAARVKRELARDGPDVRPGRVRPDTGTFDSMDFNRRGDLVVEFDDEQVAARYLGRVAVAVPNREAATLLSGVGALARAAAQSIPPGKPPPSAAFDRRYPQARSSRAGTVDCAVAKCVALTFDDGPGRYTSRLLSILTEHGARATFFMVGSNVVAQPALLRRIRDEGSLIADHSWSHRNLAPLSSARVGDQLSRTQDAVAEAVGQTPTLMRAPYGSLSPTVVQVARQLGLSIVMWNVDTRDGPDETADDVAARAIGGARRGAIIGMHDVYSATIDAIPRILTTLTQEGYVFVTVPELFPGDHMEPGHIYVSGETTPANATSPPPSSP
ncbi:hypothetical protein Misp01_39060 [Microtetraspora sp. NBRC 13810]|uniref:polysaccharide deacetylase family protein n=1 Tax=Microtetraspora sp. NBRC 13810 TaxID=3030990 RepID=UPI002552EB49|nr:polysaccharide deacetylase family protein [Microtetraspora sp. NBRC 13810]GLW08776.1 hypothetical protein Misp01_39060 [Microtetraspora sp. NBRC 13810]